MASMGLSHPSDIQWKRLCVSDDMIDTNICDAETPGKWRSSLAVFSYTPDDEYQVYDGREIVYFKVAVTLVGYQPPREEIEGELDRGEFTTENEQDFERMLESYRRCTGGLLQVSVGPPNEDEWSPGEYPYIMDYQPKRRAMYTMATDTQKRMSRSLEQTQLRKASGTTESNEILDVDLGGSQSVGGGVKGGAKGTFLGVSGKYSTSNRQRVGSKQLGKQTEDRVQSSTRSQEQREGYSHTTQLTQLHHLLNSYHKGTNRVLFFYLPRPYVKEQPTGFVQGPRGIDGVQEQLLVVNKPKQMDDVTISGRLDTSHYGETTNFDYDRTTVNVSGREIDLPPPEPQNPDAQFVDTETQQEQVDDDVGINKLTNWFDSIAKNIEDEAKDRFNMDLNLGRTKQSFGVTHKYNCYERQETKTKTWRPENNDFGKFTIDTSKNGGYEILSQRQPSGVNVSVGGNGEFLRIKTQATSRACYYDKTTYDGQSVEIPKKHYDKFDFQPVISQQHGHADVDVKVYLRTKEKTKKTGTEADLLITTRGLCCGPGELIIPDETPVDWVNVDEDLNSVRKRFSLAAEQGDEEAEQSETGSEDENGLGLEIASPAPTATRLSKTNEQSDTAGLMNIHVANELGTRITREALGKSASKRRWMPQSTLESEYTVQKLANIKRESDSGRRRLAEPATDVDTELTDALAEEFGTSLDDVSRETVVDMNTEELHRLTSLDRGTINRGKLALLGVPLRDTRGKAARDDHPEGDDARDAKADRSVDVDDVDATVNDGVDIDDDAAPDVDVGVETDVEGDDNDTVE